VCGSEGRRPSADAGATAAAASREAGRPEQFSRPGRLAGRLTFQELEQRVPVLPAVGQLWNLPGMDGEMAVVLAG